MKQYIGSNRSTNGLQNLNTDTISLDVLNEVLYTDNNGIINGIINAQYYLYNDKIGNFSFKQFTLSDIDFGLTSNRVVISDGSGGLTSSNITTTQLNQISTNTYTYSDSTTNLNLIYNYDATYKNSFIVQQYNSGYTNVLKINTDNCYIDSKNLLLNYNLAIDSNIVCKNGQSIIFNTYNGTTYTQLLKLNTSNIFAHIH